MLRRLIGLFGKGFAKHAFNSKTFPFEIFTFLQKSCLSFGILQLNFNMPELFCIILPNSYNPKTNLTVLVYELPLLITRYFATLSCIYFRAKIFELTSVTVSLKLLLKFFILVSKNQYWNQAELVYIVVFGAAL